MQMHYLFSKTHVSNKNLVPPPPTPTLSPFHRWLTVYHEILLDFDIVMDDPSHFVYRLSYTVSVDGYKSRRIPRESMSPVSFLQMQQNSNFSRCQISYLWTSYTKYKQYLKRLSLLSLKTIDYLSFCLWRKPRLYSVFYIRLSDSYRQSRRINIDIT